MVQGVQLLRREMEVITDLKKVAAVLSWDQETYMPVNGIKARTEQISLILSLAHARFTSNDFKKALGRVADLESGEITQKGCLPIESRLINLIWMDWKRAAAVPMEFVGELARLTSEAQHVWQQARSENDYPKFAPYLDKIISMKRRETDYLGYEDEPYDALLDYFEPGLTTRQLVDLFNQLRPELVSLAAKIKDADVPDYYDILEQPYDEQKQWDFGQIILKAMGYDMNSGRQDRSTHPFTTDFHPQDVRITTRIDPHNLAIGLFGTIHEGGHALYEQGLTTEYFGTPLCDAISLGIHESQSRLWENYIGRGRPFWEYYYPKLKEVFPEQLRHIDLDRFYAAVNTVRPSFIRTEADEVTYNLHIMLRFDLERDMLNGKIKADDLPELWGIGMMDSLGVKPSTDADGVLQDIHWSLGALGYFPTYALGDIYGRQIFEAACSQIVNFDERIAQGDLKTLREWLRQNIHSFGRAIDANQLLISLTGESLSVKPFINYLRKKFGRLYNL